LTVFLSNRNIHL